jgi:Flp pilus assembly protein TadG
MIRTLRRLCTSEAGAAIVEFALVGPAFIALLFAILETGVVFVTQQVLQTATTEAARLIMTGQAQTQSLSSSAFQQDVCDNSGDWLNCGNLYVNVQVFSSFTSMTMLNPIQNGRIDSTTMHFNFGGPGDIVLVQVFYQLPVYTAPLGFDLSNMSGSNRLLIATSVFRNEPYQ